MVRIGHSVFTSISHMVRNGHSVILFPNWLLSNIIYGTKCLWCKTHMPIWYEMVSGYGKNCNFVVRNGKLWYEMVSGYGTKLQFCGTKW